MPVGNCWQVPPPKIDMAFLKTIPADTESHEGPEENISGVAAPEIASLPTALATSTPDEQIEAAYTTMQVKLRGDLLERILQKDDWAFFDRVVVSLLVKMGYGGSHGSAVPQLTRSGDNGVDGLINGDRLGLDRVYVQAKMYQLDAAVGRPDVQAFVGSLDGHGATKGVFFTTSRFSDPATDYVKHLSHKRVILVGGQRLADLMIEYNVGIRDSRDPIQFKHLDEDFFSDDL